jgi:predicted metal-dependent phosphoesterase TrpH
MIRIDLHLHTRFSGDSVISPRQVVDALYAHPTVKGVAITDHDTLEGYFQVRKLAATYEDLVIIPGVEVSTKQGDIILLGTEEKPAYMSQLESVTDYAKERAALIVIPHPYRVQGIGDVAEETLADAVEVINPLATSQENKLAEKLAKARNLPGVAGSDAHRPDQMWAAYTEIYAEPNVDSVLKAIKNGRVKAIQTKHYLNVGTSFNH